MSTEYRKPPYRTNWAVRRLIDRLFGTEYTVAYTPVGFTALSNSDAPDLISTEEGRLTYLDKTTDLFTEELSDFTTSVFKTRTQCSLLHVLKTWVDISGQGAPPIEIASPYEIILPNVCKYHRDDDNWFKTSIDGKQEKLSNAEIMILRVVTTPYTRISWSARDIIDSIFDVYDDSYKVMYTTEEFTVKTEDGDTTIFNVDDGKFYDDGCVDLEPLLNSLFRVSDSGILQDVLGEYMDGKARITEEHEISYDGYKHCYVDGKPTIVYEDTNESSEPIRSICDKIILALATEPYLGLTDEQQIVLRNIFGDMPITFDGRDLLYFDEDNTKYTIYSANDRDVPAKFQPFLGTNRTFYRCILTYPSPMESRRLIGEDMGLGEFSLRGDTVEVKDTNLTDSQKRCIAWLNTKPEILDAQKRAIVGILKKSRVPFDEKILFENKDLSIQHKLSDNAFVVYTLYGIYFHDGKEWPEFDIKKGKHPPEFSEIKRVLGGDESFFAALLKTPDPIHNRMKVARHFFDAPVKMCERDGCPALEVTRAVTAYYYIDEGSGNIVNGTDHPSVEALTRFVLGSHDMPLPWHAGVYTFLQSFGAKDILLCNTSAKYSYRNHEYRHFNDPKMGYDVYIKPKDGKADPALLGEDPVLFKAILETENAFDEKEKVIQQVLKAESVTLDPALQSIRFTLAKDNIVRSFIQNYNGEFILDEKHNGTPDFDVNFKRTLLDFAFCCIGSDGKPQDVNGYDEEDTESIDLDESTTEEEIDSSVVFDSLKDIIQGLCPDKVNVVYESNKLEFHLLDGYTLTYTPFNVTSEPKDAHLPAHVVEVLDTFGRTPTFIRALSKTKVVVAGEDPNAIEVISQCHGVHFSRVLVHDTGYCYDRDGINHWIIRDPFSHRSSSSQTLTLNEESLYKACSNYLYEMNPILSHLRLIRDYSNGGQFEYMNIQMDDEDVIVTLGDSNVVYRTNSIEGESKIIYKMFGSNHKIVSYIRDNPAWMRHLDKMAIEVFGKKTKVSRQDSELVLTALNGKLTLYTDTHNYASDLSTNNEEYNAVAFLEIWEYVDYVSNKDLWVDSSESTTWPLLRFYTAERNLMAWTGTDPLFQIEF